MSSDIRDFSGDLSESKDSDQRTAIVGAIAEKRIPGYLRCEAASAEDDRRGTDYLIHRIGLDTVRIDVKWRSEDYAAKGQDDLALETWSVLDAKAGWTRDSTKNTDYILWFWLDTRRFCIVPFHALCYAFSVLWTEWKEKYGAHLQTTVGCGCAWQSEHIYVPREVVLGSIGRKWMVGTLPRTSPQPTLDTLAAP